MIEHQLSEQTYFNQDVLEAPIVNSSCETHFAILNWRAAKHGGSMPISTVSYVLVVPYDNFFRE